MPFSFPMPAPKLPKVPSAWCASHRPPPQCDRVPWRLSWSHHGLTVHDHLQRGPASRRQPDDGGGVVVAPFPHAFHYGWSLDEATDFCLKELDRIFVTYSAPPKETAAMLIEPVQGEGGYVPANARFMQGGCGSAATSTASCWCLTKYRPGSAAAASSGPTNTSGGNTRRHHDRQRPGQRLPPHFCSGGFRRNHGQGLAGFSGRHLWRQRCSGGCRHSHHRRDSGRGPGAERRCDGQTPVGQPAQFEKRLPGNGRCSGAKA